MGGCLDWVILWVFSNLGDSMILWFCDVFQGKKSLARWIQAKPIRQRATDKITDSSPPWAKSEKGCSHNGHQLQPGEQTQTSNIPKSEELAHMVFSLIAMFCTDYKTEFLGWMGVDFHGIPHPFCLSPNHCLQPNVCQWPGRKPASQPNLAKKQKNRILHHGGI